VSHARRTALKREHPSLVTLSIDRGLPSLRVVPVLALFHGIVQAVWKGAESRWLPHARTWLLARLRALRRCVVTLVEPCSAGREAASAVSPAVPGSVEARFASRRDAFDGLPALEQALRFVRP
jgi:hypothetical protein